MCKLINGRKVLFDPNHNNVQTGIEAPNDPQVAQTTPEEEQARRDEELICKARAGDWNPLFKQYKPLVTNRVYQLVPADRDPENVVGLVWEKITTHLGQFDPQKGKLSSWIRRLATNSCLDWLKKRSNRNEVLNSPTPDDPEGQSEMFLDQYPDSALTPDLNLAKAELWEMVRQAVRLLSQKERAVVIAYYIKKLTQQEIAASLGISHQRVSQIRQEAQIRLKRSLLEVWESYKELLFFEDRSRERWH
ncbi:sigma-70 family RNA polymerase sigma factor [Candidatus Poribacteria bacterium]|nr:sigma-70 family RNA polymerase sigma factor [Candidatus Poribacteria bacterium]